mgnify:CR=1 FL=1
MIQPLCNSARIALYMSENSCWSQAQMKEEGIKGKILLKWTGQTRKKNENHNKKKRKNNAKKKEKWNIKVTQQKNIANKQKKKTKIRKKKKDNNKRLT